MNAFKFIYGLIHPLGVVARFTLWGGGSGGGGSQTTYQTNIPEYAKPYVETMLGATQKQLFQGTPTEGGGFDITGFQPYKAYGGTYDEQGNQTSYDPSKSIAGFQPMQQQAMSTAANMQSNPETFSQGVGGYMSPFAQYALQPQLQEASRQSAIQGTQQQAQAAQAGAFGGGRDALMRSERERNLGQQQSNIMATGMQNAYNQAQQQYNTGFQQNLGINQLQNQYGAQQQAQQQQIINQGMQDYANAQQYPLMQLGTMSNMIRGLPMQASTTNQYAAAPNAVTQGIGAVGAGASLLGAMNSSKAEGGVIKGYAKGGILSYDVGGEVEHDLYNMDEQGLQKELRESSSPTVKRIAQRLLRMKQMENQPQQPQPNYAGGGIVAFAGGGTSSASEELQQRVLQGNPTGDIKANPVPIQSGILPEPREAVSEGAAPAPKIPTTVEALQASPDMNPLMKSMYSDAATDYAIPIQERMARKQAERQALGIGNPGVEQMSRLMAEKANAEDETQRNRYYRAAQFFAKWGSTPGPTLAAGLKAVNETIPDVITDEKEAKKARMEIEKAMGNIEEATRLEKKGDWEGSTAEKEKAASRMQALNVKFIEFQEVEQKTQAAEKRAQIRADADFNKMVAHDTNQANLQNIITDKKIASDEKIAALNADWHKAEKQNWTDSKKQQLLQAAISHADQVENQINNIMKTTGYMDAMRDRSMYAGKTEPASKAAFDAADQTVRTFETNFETMRKNAKTTVDSMKTQLNLPLDKSSPSGDKGKTPPPPPGAKLD